MVQTAVVCYAPNSVNLFAGFAHQMMHFFETLEIFEKFRASNGPRSSIPEVSSRQKYIKSVLK